MIAVNTAMNWKDAGNIIIGKDMDGGGRDIPVFDNLVIRNTGSVTPLAESLINFMLESTNNSVKVHWASTTNDRSECFIIQRSVNGIDFSNIATLPSNPEMKSDEEYVYTDNTPSSGYVIYYRLRQNFKDGKFITHSVSAIKPGSKQMLSIERVNPM